MHTAEHALIKREVLRLTGVDLDHYKTAQMQRRLQAYLKRSGHPDWPTFFRALRNDPVALEKFKAYLTINVSSFFRDIERFRHLHQAILPELLRARSKLRVWSAGCSRGQEPYSLAILLAELAGPLRRHYILATDIDRSALEWARAGGPYTAEEVKDVPPSWLQRYFTHRDGAYWVTEELKEKVQFREHNLLSDPYEKDFDLIVCRNVVIYFTAEVKQRLYRRFRDALRPGGVFFVGGTEIVLNARELGLEMVGISFYRRNNSGR